LRFKGEQDERKRIAQLFFYTGSLNQRISLLSKVLQKSHLDYTFEQ